MENQFFGDLRDLFKFDLILNILKGVGSLHQLTYIPMLTENDFRNPGHGNKRNFDEAKIRNLPGTRNCKLVEFLEPFKDVEADKRDIRYIESYFNSEGHKISIYNGRKDLYFNNGIRIEYFSEIPKELLTNSLIFIDPDIGLEIQESTKKHLLYIEVKSLYERMDQDSIMMIFQYFPMINHEDYLDMRSEDLEKITGNLPQYISDNEIIFFFLTKNVTTKNSLQRTLEDYGKKYKRLKVSPKKMSITLVSFKKITPINGKRVF